MTHALSSLSLFVRSFVCSLGYFVSLRACSRVLAPGRARSNRPFPRQTFDIGSLTILKPDGSPTRRGGEGEGGFLNSAARGEARARRLVFDYKWREGNMEAAGGLHQRRSRGPAGRHPY